MGGAVGDKVGDSVGDSVGAGEIVGSRVGLLVGEDEGAADGATEGEALGACEGDADGRNVGTGVIVGAGDGIKETVGTDVANSLSRKARAFRSSAIQTPTPSAATAANIRMPLTITNRDGGMMTAWKKYNGWLPLHSTVQKNANSVRRLSVCEL